MEHMLHNSQQLRVSIAGRPFVSRREERGWGRPGNRALQSGSRMTQGPDCSISTNMGGNAHTIYCPPPHNPSTCTHDLMPSTTQPIHTSIAPHRGRSTGAWNTSRAGWVFCLSVARTGAVQCSDTWALATLHHAGLSLRAGFSARIRKCAAAINARPPDPHPSKSPQLLIAPSSCPTCRNL